MNVLFDQATPLPLKKYLANHVVKTAYQQGWSMVSNGELIALAEQGGFEVLVTSDQNIEYQQNLSSRTIAIVVIGKGNWSRIEPHAASITAAVNAATQGSYTKVDIP